MKIKTSEAASRLRMHPLNLLVKVFPMVGGIEDCWPELDEGYVETLMTMSSIQHPPTPTLRGEPPSARQVVVEPQQVLDQGSLRVLEKLWRKDRWGGKAVSWDTLHNHYCQEVENLEDALEDLAQRGILLRQSKKGPFSLDPNKKGAIEKIMNAALGRSS